MPVSAIGALMAEHDTKLWRVVRHYVEPVRKSGKSAQARKLMRGA
jgi:hypothetical protein